MITAVVCAAFDAATDEAVLATRDILATLGVRLAEHPAHRPHLTLAAARIEPDELPSVLHSAATVAARHRRITITLAEVGRFDGSGVIWLGPRPSAELTGLQRDVDGVLLGAGWPRAFGQRSDPAQWTPHCTLAVRVPPPRLPAVLAALRAHYRPVEARIEGLATILVGGRGDVGYTPLG